jgi:CubicO group peptidase (beta-lactamase class C family)
MFPAFPFDAPHLVAPMTPGFLAATLALLIGAGRAAHAADPSPAAIDSLFARHDRTNAPGCALGVYRNDRMVYARGYGMANLEQRIAIGPQTVFYIASTSKQFTAMSIAILAEEGRLSLADPARKWIPELPAYADRVTVRHLVHHTSGVRDYLGLWGMSGRSFADEIPQEVALDLLARQAALDFEPGTRYSYSNGGYLLLSEVVRRASGKSLREFAAERIFRPLGMSSTQFHDDATRIVERRAEGYQQTGPGQFAIVRTSFALVGDGGLLTTVEDLLRWDANFYQNRLGRGDSSLIRLVTTPPSEPLADGSKQTYAFGLTPSQYRGVGIIEHGGAFIGFRANLLRVPEAHLSVAVLCNDAGAAPEALARQVVDRYLADRLAPVTAAASPASAPAANVPVETLEGWTGRYEVIPGQVATVSREGQSLILSVAGLRLPLTATSDSTFTAGSLSAPFVFARTDRGPTVRTSAFGMAAPAPRLAAAPPLSAAQKGALAGRYTSDELDSWATIAVRGDSLMLRVRWGAWQRLEPIAPDVFVVPGMRLEFSRSRAGAVTGFGLSQGRARNVRFVRAR